MRRALLGVPVCAAILAGSPCARSQTASPEDKASARVLGTEGTRLADAGNCAAAVIKLAAAEKLFHAPTTLDRLGECQIALGQLVAGTESLNRVVREVLPPGAPSAFVAAQERARKALTAAEPRIGSLKIHVDGAPADQVAVTVDGVAVPSALLDGDRPTDPGVHEVKASAPGFSSVSTTASVRDGAEATVSLRLSPGASAVAPAPGETAPATPGTAVGSPSPQPAAVSVASPSTSAGSEREIAIGALVVGGVGVAVGSVLGIMALGTKSTLDSACPNKMCPASSQSDVSALSTKATISTIGFGVGIVGLAVGGILLAVSHTHKGTATTSAALTPQPHVSLWLGATSAGVGGTFQ